MNLNILEQNVHICKGTHTLRLSFETEDNRTFYIALYVFLVLLLWCVWANEFLYVMHQQNFPAMSFSFSFPLNWNVIVCHFNRYTYIHTIIYLNAHIHSYFGTFSAGTHRTIQANNFIVQKRKLIRICIVFTCVCPASISYRGSSLK